MTEQLRKIGIVPVVVLESAEPAKELAATLVEGGLPCAEVTFRTDAAEAVIRAMIAAEPSLLVGAGTVLTAEQADRAIDAGAKFIVSPGFNPKVTERVLSKGVPMIPGVCTPTEIEAALSLGLTALKFFPAEMCGGIRMVKALAAPYTRVSFMPTGGINAENVGEYLRFPRVLACGGSWMVSGNLVRENRFDEILRLTREASNIVHEIRG